MMYVALLRGINVGGNNKVEMPRLRQAFESLGYGRVSTYINSGNVVFEASQSDIRSLSTAIESAVESRFGFTIKTLVVKSESVLKIAAEVPADWVNDGAEMKCDVLFLWPEIDSPAVLDQLDHRPGIDELLYFPGAVVWRVLRKDYGKSGMNKLIGSEVYKKSTARNINTVRKLAQMIDGVS
jgi:uncharacterized protein (DUF1697 family)